MRFMTGMFFGTAFTLLAATAMEAPTQSLIDRTSSQLQAAWQMLVETTSDALFESTAQTFHSAQLATLETTEREPSAETAVSDTPTVTSTAPSWTPPTVAEPGAPPAKELSDPTQIERDANDHKPLIAAQTREQASIAPPSMDDPAPSLMAAGSTPDPMGPPMGIWIPFHSEVSARGFARRLSRELNHPFEVQRLGPGAYQVVLSGVSADDYDGLEARIMEVTGG